MADEADHALGGTPGGLMDADHALDGQRRNGLDGLGASPLE